jgi:ABC-type transporter Mla maintaining outer membrane lipid asymmetry ATPase subunit MlaF
MEQNMITIRNLSKEFKGQSVLKNITMEIPKNCVYGLLRGKIHAVENNHRIVKPYVR